MSNSTTVTTFADFADIPMVALPYWRKTAILDNCFKYFVDFHEPNKVHFFKTLREVKAFIKKQPYHRRHNYSLWRMLIAINVNNFDDDSRYWMMDLSYNYGGIVACGDQWKSEGLRHNIGRPNCYMYKQINTWHELQKAKR